MTILPAARITQPLPGARVWRYLSFGQLSDLIRTGELYLRRIDCFSSDRWEGTWHRGPAPIFDQRGDSAEISLFLEKQRTHTFASCWTLGLSDRWDMWQREANVDVALTATYGRLIDSLWEGPYDLSIGLVQYFESMRQFVSRHPIANTLDLAYAKRMKFSREREVRVVFQDHRGLVVDDHIRVPINLLRLRPSIILRPEASEELVKKVSDLLDSRAVAV